ncbi:LOW QUALITY PROTEIN: hypothetical protein QTO34_018319 [Cnephaeus nilssonii]|uniref:Homeobox domain-containing protein n=1 Tax=Cnephaeus nilssonii TaxID=3371016 RepID=A0AA40LPV8_CNENI|nr:LOW QUALITY PROTEIN: hypothetical protein QTO34_018319 [Eptesicus nilssonii]
MQQLSNILNLSYKQIKTWFQNQRMKCKRWQKYNWPKNSHCVTQTSSATTEYVGLSSWRPGEPFGNLSMWSNPACSNLTWSHHSWNSPSWTHHSWSSKAWCPQDCNTQAQINQAWNNQFCSCGGASCSPRSGSSKILSVIWSHLGCNTANPSVMCRRRAPEDSFRKLERAAFGFVEIVPKRVTRWCQKIPFENPSHLTVALCTNLCASSSLRGLGALRLLPRGLLLGRQCKGSSHWPGQRPIYGRAQNAGLITEATKQAFFQAAHAAYSQQPPPWDWGTPVELRGLGAAILLKTLLLDLVQKPSRAGR